MRIVTIRITHLLVIFLFSAVLSACAWIPPEEYETRDWSASKLYSEAKNSLNSEDYETAIRYYELLEARYPFGRYAQQGQIEIAYAYYKYDEPESAIAAVDRFIKLHPQHPHVDYAYYLKGLINYNVGSGVLERIFPRDPATRDPGSARQAFFDFRTLVSKFPNSKYAADAHQRLIYLRNNLAMHEIIVARYYYERKAYVAVINRAKYVLEHYDQSAAVPEALALMALAYDQMGYANLAADARRVLETNYPDGPKTKPPKRSWWNIF